MKKKNIYIYIYINLKVKKKKKNVVTEMRGQSHPMECLRYCMGFIICLPAGPSHKFIFLSFSLLGPQLMLPKPFCLISLLKGGQANCNNCWSAGLYFNVSWILRHIVERQCTEVKSQIQSFSACWFMLYPFHSQRNCRF